MKKITLDLDALAVDTFETVAPRESALGTVRGLEGSETVCVTVGGYECVSQYTDCDCTDAWDCSGQLTCHFSCVDTCDGETC